MNKIYWSIALENSVAVICWTFLAWHFDKWWIALFSVLFMTTAKWRESDERKAD